MFEDGQITISRGSSDDVREGTFITEIIPKIKGLHRSSSTRLHQHFGFIPAPDFSPSLDLPKSKGGGRHSAPLPYFFFDRMSQAFSQYGYNQDQRWQVTLNGVTLEAAHASVSPPFLYRISPPSSQITPTSKLGRLYCAGVLHLLKVLALSHLHLSLTALSLSSRIPLWDERTGMSKVQPYCT
jgi:hypothetical protein